MLEMPLEDSTMPKSREIGPSAEKMKTSNSGSNFLFGHGQLMNYATVAQMNEQPSSNAQSNTAICSSPLDQLIKLHERFQQGEFSTSTSAILPNSTSSISTSKSSISVAQSSASVKTPPAVMNPTSIPPPPTSAFDHFGTAFGCPQSLLDPSSLMFSSYTAANAAHLGPTMVAAAAAAAAPWSSPAACWSWNAAANETTAALLNGGGGGGSPNGAGWSSVASAGHHYFGNPFGAAAALVPTQFSTTTSTSQLGPSNSKNLTTMTSAPGKNGIVPKQTLPKSSNSTKRPNGTSLSLLPTESRSIRGMTSSNSSKGQRSNGGGKMRATASGTNGHNSSAASSAKMTCECPNCKELQRIGAPLDKKREKHSCHIPGCHKVFSRSSHLKAHLRWHSTDRPATTKRRLFDPPDGPLLAENLLRKENAAAISISQAENR